MVEGDLAGVPEIFQIQAKRLFLMVPQSKGYFLMMGKVTEKQRMITDWAISTSGIYVKFPE